MPEQASSVSKTILLVDDDDSLRRVLTTALTKDGFCIVEASDGTAAINILRNRGLQIDVILLDFELPGASSLEVFQQATTAGSRPRVVVMSAHTRQAIDTAFAGLELDDFIRKPFRLSNLVRMLRNTQSA